MSIEENKGMIFHVVEEFNRGNLAVINECFADNFVRYQDGSTATLPNMDRNGYKNFVGMSMQASSDIHVEVVDIVAEGDRVAFRWTLKGTNDREFMGKPPTGKPYSHIEDYFVRFEEGKIVEFRNLYGGQTGHKDY